MREPLNLTLCEIFDKFQPSVSFPSRLVLTPSSHLVRTNPTLCSTFLPATTSSTISSPDSSRILIEAVAVVFPLLLRELDEE